jgi:hypothetical protein
MIKNSKVLSAQANGTYNSEKYGLFYKYEIAFENGDSGEYSSKSDSQNKFIPGEVAYYTAEQNSNGYWKIKPQSKEYAESLPETSKATSVNSNGNDRSEAIARQSSLKCAVEYHIANGGDLKDILETAELFSAFAMTGKKIDGDSNEVKTTDDLPF